MKAELPEPVNRALLLLNQAGFEAHVVGGCVRDLLMNKTPKDYDLTTSAHPEAIQRVFQGFPMTLDGLKHGTVRVILNHEPLEITTFRVDCGYSDGRHPDAVRFTPSLTEDLLRRDFTINAMAYAPSSGLSDPFDGRRDIQNRLIRCVGDPERRFAEDALRILRGLRFASVLDFEIHPDTLRAMERLSPSLNAISAERVEGELMKLLNGPAACRALKMGRSALFVRLPELDDAGYDARAEALTRLPHEPALRLAMLLSHLSQPTLEHVLNRLKCSRLLSQRTLHALDALQKIPFPPQDAALRLFIRENGYEAAFDALNLKLGLTRDAAYARALETLERLSAEGACLSLKNLNIDGRALLRAGMTPGPQVGRVLNELLNQVVRGELPNQHGQLLAAAQVLCKKMGC